MVEKSNPSVKLDNFSVVRTASYFKHYLSLIHVRRIGAYSFQTKDWYECTCDCKIDLRKLVKSNNFNFFEYIDISNSIFSNIPEKIALQHKLIELHWFNYAYSECKAFTNRKQIDKIVFVH